MLNKSTVVQCVGSICTQVAQAQQRCRPTFLCLHRYIADCRMPIKKIKFSEKCRLCSALWISSFYLNDVLASRRQTSSRCVTARLIGEKMAICCQGTLTFLTSTYRLSEINIFVQSQHSVRLLDPPWLRPVLLHDAFHVAGRPRRPRPRSHPAPVLPEILHQARRKSVYM